MEEKILFTVTMSVTESQAIALKEMFNYYNQLGKDCLSRQVAFYCDGEGNFKPDCIIATAKPLPELSQEKLDKTIVMDDEGHRLYDYAPII